ncbi:MAG: hypothetical protein HQL52_15645 [Magnetococcales bacterium]|nr:hypothetical protein [Magnetococcales bacterium]
MKSAPREIRVPHRKIPLNIPEGMTPVEFFNSATNLRHLAGENGLVRTAEDFLLYRKAIGHSLEFDASIILDTSQRVLDPLGRPVRRDQLTQREKIIWSRMTQVVFEAMLEKYPDPDKALVFCGEASLDATWPLSKRGVPSIRMIHNHFIVYKNQDLINAKMADPEDPNLDDSGHNGLFLHLLSEVYHRFLEVLNLEVLVPIATDDSRLKITGFPQGLPSWEVKGGAEALKTARFWEEYDMVLRGFLDFYRTFFSQVSANAVAVPDGASFPDQVENVLLFNNTFMSAARMVRLRVLEDPRFANEIRWRPAYKQLIYRDCADRLIVTISQNSVGNAITELLGIVVKRVPDEQAYAQAEPALMERLLDVRNRLVAADLGEPVNTPSWPNGQFIPAKDASGSRQYGRRSTD